MREHFIKFIDEDVDGCGTDCKGLRSGRKHCTWFKFSG